MQGTQPISMAYVPQQRFPQAAAANVSFFFQISVRNPALILRFIPICWKIRNNPK